MNTPSYADQLNQAVRNLQSRLLRSPDWVIVLGSGLGGFSSYLESASVLPYASIPGFPESTVKGHAGQLCAGKRHDRYVVVMEGRFHVYEGHSCAASVLPARALARCGATRFLLTNAAGGIRTDLVPGDFMLIEDHINLMGVNPLTGPNLDDLGSRFPAMQNAYDPTIRKQIQSAAGDLGITLKSGVYCALQGPNYETQAEIRMLERLGADAVGMSTVPEVIALRHADVPVAAISLITNNTRSTIPPTHTEVVEMGARKREELHRILDSLIARHST